MTVLESAVHELEVLARVSLARRVPAQGAGRRYASAKALADDLRSFLNGQPIQGRPISFTERAWKWMKRRPAAAVLLIVLGLVVIVGFPGTTVLWLEAARSRNDEAKARQRAQQEERLATALRSEAEQREVRLTLDRGLNLCEQGDVGRGLLWLTRSLELAGQFGDADLENAIRVNLADWSTQLSVAGPALKLDNIVTNLAYRPDGKALLVAWGTRARQWDITTLEPLGSAVGLDFAGLGLRTCGAPLTARMGSQRSSVRPAPRPVPGT
jgi:hypothetical protein